MDLYKEDNSPCLLCLFSNRKQTQQSKKILDVAVHFSDINVPFLIPPLIIGIMINKLKWAILW